MSYTALYIDVENLLDDAKPVILATMEQWPDDFPSPNALNLYVDADRVELWRIWTTHRFPSLDIHVKGVQHYTAKGSKNSADISLALDILADLLKNRVTHAAVLSDDSDFVNLFSKINIETSKMDNGKYPFLWFLTDRIGSKSPVFSQFLPPHYIRTIECTKKIPVSRKKASTPGVVSATSIERPSPHKESTSQEKQIAKVIIEKLPVGTFKSTDCAKVIKEFFPRSPLTNLDSASFGTHFSKTIWPELEKYGVRISNPNRKPRRYELTNEVKQQVGQIQ
jgi:hypothetical protein